MPRFIFKWVLSKSIVWIVVCTSIVTLLIPGCNRSLPATDEATQRSHNVAAAHKAAHKVDATSHKVVGPPREPASIPADELPPQGVLESAYTWPDETLRERVVLLTPGGPLVLDAWLAIEGRPHREAFDKIVDAVLIAGDTDGDGRATWREWQNNSEFFSQFIPQQVPSQQQLEMWVETYDQNRDRRIGRREITAWLGRDTGRAAAALSLRSARTRTTGLASDSRLWNLLDNDLSDGLSQSELGQASEALWSLDADDDRVLTNVELTSLNEQLATSRVIVARPTRIAKRHAALHLGPHFDMGRLGYLLADMYSPHSSLTTESFTDMPGLFSELDDGDEWLDDNDLRKLSTITPHVRMSMAFHDTADIPPIIEHIELSPRVEQLQIAAKPSGSRVVLKLGGNRLVLSVHDLTAATSPPDNLHRSQTQLMVHDQCDVCFEYVDANADGRLGEREVATAADQLAACDADDDGVVSSSELPYTLIVAFTRGENPSAMNFYVPQSPPASVASTAAPPWFVAADFNGDGDLGPREFLGPPEAFRDLDTSADGFVDAREAAAAR